MLNVEAHPENEKIFNSLLQTIGVGHEAFNGRVSIQGFDPVVSSRHRIGGATASALAAQGTALAAIWKQKTGRDQDISVEVRRAAVPGLRTAYHLSQNGYPVDVFPRSPYPQTDFFRARDGRQIYILRSPMYSQNLLGTLELLKCSLDPTDMSRAVMQWDGFELEEAMAERKLVGVMCRTREEWLAHPQGKWLASRPPVQIEKIGESEPIPLPNGVRPLGGLRVMDFAHVLAGPVTSRMLAEHGADVLRITAPHQHDQLFCALDTGVGKRSANLNLERPADVEHAKVLAATADVFAHSWRPGSLDARGLSPEALAEIRPGIIYVSVSAYGSGGPWKMRGGYEPVGQAVCGLSFDEGSIDSPQLSPTGTLNDYLTAYLSAAGILGALLRRAREGGSYHVTASLTRTSMWLQEIGQLPRSEWPKDMRLMDPLLSDMQVIQSPYGSITLPSPITQFSETRAYWDRGPEPFGASCAEWLPK